MTDPLTLHVIGGCKLGGAERFYVRLVNSLAANGQPVMAGVVQGGEIDAALSPTIPRIYVRQMGVWDLWSRWRLGRAIRRYRPAVVLTYMGRATRLVHLPTGGHTVHIARLGGFYNLKGYTHAHAWVGNTLGICKYLIAGGLPAARVFHIGNFVDTPMTWPQEDLAELRHDWKIPADASVVLGLGRLHPNKGFADLLEAFARLPARLDGRPLWLVMVGDGPLRESLRAKAAELGIAERVVWTGWQHDPAPWYQLAELFVCSSRHEPLGNVILEAWANGTPVLSTAAEGPLELLEDGKDGFLAPVANTGALAEKMRAGLSLSGERRQEICDAGRTKISGQFSEKAIVDAYLQLFRALTP